MKTSASLVGIVIALHGAIIGALFFIQGCGTTARTRTPSAASTPSMPPTTKEAVSYPAPAEKPLMAKPEPAKLPKTTETTEYMVRSGDSVAGIAKQYGIAQSEIIELNKISDPNKLRVGQKLLLPGQLTIKAAPVKPASKVKAVEPAKSATPASWQASFETEAPIVPATGNEHVVQKGDSLSKVAKKYGTTVSALREVNKLSSDKLLVGQKLLISSASGPLAAAPAVAASAAPAAAPVTEAPIAPPPAETTPAIVPAEPAAPAKPVASSGIKHTVQPKEDLNSIAQLYAVTVEEVVELNQLGTNRTVQVGQRLNIP